MAVDIVSYLSLLASINKESLNIFTTNGSKVSINQKSFDFVFESLGKADKMYEEISIPESWKNDFDSFMQECLVSTRASLFTCMLTGETTIDQYRYFIYPTLIGLRAYITYLLTLGGRYYSPTPHQLSLLHIYNQKINTEAGEPYIVYHNFFGRAMDNSIIIAKAMQFASSIIVPFYDGTAEIIVFDEIRMALGLKEEYYHLSNLPIGISHCEIDLNQNYNPQKDQSYVFKMW